MYPEIVILRKKKAFFVPFTIVFHPARKNRFQVSVSPARSPEQAGSPGPYFISCAGTMSPLI
jgi:hypothetical protein